MSEFVRQGQQDGFKWTVSGINVDEAWEPELIADWRDLEWVPGVAHPAR